MLVQSLDRIRGQEMLDAVAVTHFGDLDRAPDAFGLAEVVAAVVDQQVELGPSHAEGVYPAIVLPVHLDGLLKVPIGALAAEPEVFPQELGLGSVIPSRRPHADTEYLFHQSPPYSRR